METCGFYREHRKGFASNEVHSHMQQEAATVSHIPWCSHPKHSPAELAYVTSVIGGARVLQCGGDFSKCQIPSDKFTDIS